jgi:hypothetical protein
MSRLLVDADQMREFVDGVFPLCLRGMTISLRTFDDGGRRLIPDHDNVATLPVRYQPPPTPPLPDAAPIGRASTIIVEPDSELGGCTLIECSGCGAGLFGTGLLKADAIAIALDYVRRWNAEMYISEALSW